MPRTDVDPGTRKPTAPFSYFAYTFQDHNRHWSPHLRTPTKRLCNDNDKLDGHALV